MNQSPTEHDFPSINQPKLIKQLLQILPSESVLYQEEDLRPYECDGLSAYHQLPLIVALPDSIEQVQSILRLCNEINLPVVARGAGTGLSGGALPFEQGLLLSLAKLNNIIEIDRDLRIARVQPGVRNLAISQAVEHLGLFYAPDPSSQIACTIGGNVAENSGGVHCLKYGLTVHNIQQLKIITIGGELVTLGGSGLDSPGYDLLALLTGSEGLLGVIVEITVKLLAKPDRIQVLLAAFDDVVKAGGAVGNIISAGIIPAGLEMMDKLGIQAAEDFVHVGYPTEAEAILICELDGTGEEVASHVNAVTDILKNSGATEVRIAKDQQEAMNFMRRNVDAWWPYVEQGIEAIVITASGCGAVIKEYEYLLKHDIHYADKAKKISQLTKDISEILIDEIMTKKNLTVEHFKPSTRHIVFHSPCTLQHGQKLDGVVESVLKHCGFELSHVTDAHLCCGSAGTYSILQADLSQQLLHNKLNALQKHRPELIVTANIGCQLHLQSQAAVPVRHWIELVDESFLFPVA